MTNLDKIETIANVIRADVAARAGSDIDLAATLRLHIKALQAVEKEITGKLTADVELTNETEQGKSATLPGVAFYASITEAVRWTFDSKAVKAEMGTDWYNERCKPGVVRTVKYYDV